MGRGGERYIESSTGQDYKSAATLGNAIICNLKYVT
jgi:hypothetical protein